MLRIISHMCATLALAALVRSAVAQAPPAEIAPIVAQLVRTYEKAPDGQEFFYIRVITIDPLSGALWVAYGEESEPPARIDRVSGVAKVIGRTGRGPNEFARIIAMQPGPAGEIGIWDPARRLWFWVDASGVQRRNWPLLTSNYWYGKVFTDMRGRVYIGQGSSNTRAFAVRLDSATGLRDTIVVPLAIPQGGGWTARTANGSSSTRALFSANIDWGVDRLGRIFAARTDSNFVVLRDGQTEKRLLLPSWRESLTAADRRRATALLDTFEFTARSRGAVLDGPRPAIPNTKPQIDQVLPEINGGIAIRRTRLCANFPVWRAPITGARAVADTAQCTIVERFDESGRRLAPFTLSPEDQLRAIRADTVWITRSDSLGLTKILELVLPRS